MKTHQLIADMKVELDALLLRLEVDDASMEHLNNLYCIIWSEAHTNQSANAFAAKLWPHIKALNDKFHFKR